VTRTPFRSAWQPALLATAISVSGTATAAPQSLDELVVVGSRAPSQISQVPGAVWVLEQEDLAQQFQSGQDLKTVLGKLIPGMDLAPETRTNFGQNLRGRSVLVMIDGVSLNGSRGLSRQFDSIDPFNIERIEVLSGATSVYGGGATGGIVNIITKKGEAGETQFGTELGASTGFNDSEDRVYRFGQSISGGNEDANGRLSIAVQDNGAFYDGDGDPITPDISQTDLQYNRSVDIMGNTRFRIDGNQSLELTAQLYNSQFKGDKGLWFGPYLSQRANPEIRDGFTADREPETDRYLLNASYQNRDFLGHTAYLQVSSRHEESSFHPYPYPRLNQDGTLNAAMSYYGASKQNTEQHLVKALLVKQLDDLKLSYGLDLDREDFDASQMVFDNALAYGSGGLVFEEDFTVPRYPGYRVDGIAAYLQAEWQATDRLQLNAGVRQRYSELEMESFTPTTQQIAVERGLVTGADAIPGGESDYDVTLINAGAIFNLTADQQIWANYSQGFEIPDPGKVAGKGDYTITQDGRYTLTDYLDVNQNAVPGLKTDQIELGWRAYQDRWDAQIAAYYTWSDKDTETTDDLRIRVVDAKTRDYGIEGNLTFRATEQVSVGTSGHYIHSEVKEGGDWIEKVATYASLPKVTAFTQWQDDLNSVRLQASHSFDIDDDAGQEVDGTTLLDLQASRQLPVGKLNFAVSNLLDKQYQTVWGQRAQLFYGARFAYEPFDFKGKGRTYTLTYAVNY
jgi:iron complex outermembrane receptor protein